MKRSYASFQSEKSVELPEGEQGFWPSYTDMMSSVALILFFLMLICYIQNLLTGKRLETTSTELADTKTSLASTMVEIEAAKAELEAISTQLTDAETAIALQNAQINEKNAQLTELSVSLEEKQQALLAQQATLDLQQATLDSQEAMIAEQKAYISLTTEELTKLRQQMQTIAFLRLEVLDRIKTSIGSSLGDANKVTVGDNGSLILNEGLLFDFNSASIKKESYAMLDNLANAFVSFLSVDDNAHYVDSIVISGHTDSRGTAERNRALSTERANSVLEYLFATDGGALSPYSEYFCGAGYGADRPVASNETDEGRESNRRIEISIILKDESVLDIVDSYLQSEIPTDER